MKDKIIGGVAILFLLAGMAALAPGEPPEGTPQDPWIIPNPATYAIHCASYEYDLSGIEVEIATTTDHNTLVAHILHKTVIPKNTPVSVPIMNAVRSLPNGLYDLRLRVIHDDKHKSPWSQWLTARKEWKEAD